MKKLKILNIVGARPQIIKASAISRAIAGEFAGEIDEVVVHTGQHYDRELSAVFFDELEIRMPDHNLQVGSGRHGRQTGMIMERIEDVIMNEKPAGLRVRLSNSSNVTSVEFTFRYKLSDHSSA